MLISSASLKVAELDLAAARSHVQQFKEISQASEEALASLNATYDEYKSTTEAQLATSWVIFTLCESILTTTHLFLFRPNKNPFRRL
jgi:nucleoprotein TPR